MFAGMMSPFARSASSCVSCVYVFVFFCKVSLFFGGIIAGVGVPGRRLSVLWCGVGGGITRKPRLVKLV